MRRNLTLTLLLGLALVSTGCLRSSSTVTVHRNGSATITDSMLFAPRFLAMMSSLGEMGDSTESSGLTLWSDSTLRADAADFGPTVSLKEWKEIEVDGLKGYVAVYQAPQVADIVLDGNRGANKVQTGEDDPSTDNAEKSDPWRMTYENGILTIVNPPDSATADAMVAEPVQEQTSDEERRQTLDMMAGFLRGMRISVRVVVDGPISQTNATYANASTVTLLYMDFDKLVDVWENDPATFKDFESMQEGNAETLGQLLKAYPPGSLMIETQPVVTVRF